MFIRAALGAAGIELIAENGPRGMGQAVAATLNCNLAATSLNPRIRFLSIKGGAKQLNQESKMPPFKKISPFVLLSFLVTAQPALSWDLSVDGPDVFDVTSATLSAEVRNTTDLLRFECSTEKTPIVAWLISAEDVKNPNKLDGKIIIQVKGEGRVSIPAVTSAWNKNYFALLGRDSELISEALSLVKGAVIDIQVGYVIPKVGLKQSGSITAIGSTRATDGFLRTCLVQNDKADGEETVGSDT